MQQKARQILTKLRSAYPEAKVELKHGNVMQFLVAVILSAQCTDKRVNIVTKELFKKYKTAKDFAKANLKTFEQEIRSTGFYRNKAKNIIGSAKKIVKEHKGRVPLKMDNLLTLPGVARKTANVVLGVYGTESGIAVDTHVMRVSQRLGLTEQIYPDKIEQDLVKIFPKKEWRHINTLLVWHGRYTCKARKPECKECVLRSICPSAASFLRLSSKSPFHARKI